MTGFSNSGGGGSSTPGTLTIPGQSYVPAASGPATTNTRRPVLALGGDGYAGPVTPTNSDVCQRYGFTLPSTGGASIARFRFRLRNADNLNNTTTAGAVTLGAFAIGTPNVGSENVWAGDFTAVPTTVVAAPGSTELGTSEYVSPWVSPATFALTPNTFYGLTLGFTCSGVQVNKGQTPGWSWVGTGSAAAALLAAAPGTTPQPYVQYLDLRIEYEFAGTNEIGLFIGDSLCGGYLNLQTGPPATGHMGPDNTWPHQAALRLGHHDMNAGVGAALTGAFTAATPATNLAWSRFLSPESGQTAFASTPDYLHIALGTNDCLDLGSDPTPTFQAGVRTIISRATLLGIPRVYASTAQPATQYSFGGITPCCQAGQLAGTLAGAFTIVPVCAEFGAGVGNPKGTPGYATLSAATNAGTTITATVPDTTGMVVGGPVGIANASGGTWSRINGLWTVASIISGTQFTFVNTLAPTGSYSASSANVLFGTNPIGPGGAFAQPGQGTAWKNSGANNNLFLGTPQQPVAGGGPIPVTLVFGPGQTSMLMAASGTATATAGTPVLTASEYYRQEINLWLRSLPPGIQSIIDLEAQAMDQFYYPTCTPRREFYNDQGDVHPTGPGLYSFWAGLFANGILGN